MNDTAVRKVWILPGFTAILVTVLLLWLAGTVADLLLLLFLGILLAVYLSAVTDVLAARTRLPRGAAFALSIVLTVGALVGIGFLLVPPVIEQTRQLVAVLVMAIYFALRPDLYRDLAISVTPPRHREAAHEVISALSETLRAWTIAQLLAMVTLAALTALGLWLLDVPYWLAFGIFTGLVAVVPFFGTFVSTLVPALFVLPTEGGGTRALLVILLGTVIHVAENQLVVPLLMHRKVDLPPVLTIMSVLICGKLLGPFGLLVAVPTLAVVMVLVRRVLIGRIYQDEELSGPVVKPVISRRQRRRMEAQQRGHDAPPG